MQQHRGGHIISNDSTTLYGRSTSFLKKTDLEHTEFVNLAANLSNAITVDTQFATKTDKSTMHDSTTAWSSGLASDGYHYIDTGSDALVIRTPKR